MNHITIKKLSDLQTIIEEPLSLSGQQFLTSEQTYHHMWAITFNDALIPKINLNDLTKFFTQLLQQRQHQLHTIDPTLKATFYLWFDKQALQLRFNLLCGIQDALPFGCSIKKIKSLEIILQNFLTTMRQITAEGDTVEFLNPLEDQDARDDDDENYTLDVYSTIINKD